MSLMNKVAIMLRALDINEIAHFHQVSLKAINSTLGCEGCVFETEEGADTCKLKFACMAHYRSDNESVVFVKSTIK